MHRRVAIVRSFAAVEPKMFLYDEPTSGLDPIQILIERDGLSFIEAVRRLAA